MRGARAGNPAVLGSGGYLWSGLEGALMIRETLYTDVTLFSDGLQ